MRNWHLEEMDGTGIPVTFNPRSNSVVADVQELPPSVQILYWVAPPSYLGEKVRIPGSLCVQSMQALLDYSVTHATLLKVIKLFILLSSFSLCIGVTVTVFCHLCLLHCGLVPAIPHFTDFARLSLSMRIPSESRKVYSC